MTLNLTIKNSGYSTQNLTACDQYTWPTSGLTYTVSGTYSSTLTNINGCDSVVTLNLTINNSNSSTQNVTACNQYVWSASDLTYTASGTYTATLSNFNGCDSVVTLNLTINNSNSSAQNVMACNQYIWPATILTYTASGTYSTTLTNLNGCDSVVTLNLTINTPTSNNQNVSACGQYTWPATGLTYTTSGTYSVTLTNFNGCDSVVALSLTINHATSSNQNVSACGQYIWSATGLTYTTSGTYSVTLTNFKGCDSVITLNLTILATPFVSIETNNGHKIISAEANVSGGVSPYSYLWMPGGKTTEKISGLTVGTTYSVTVTGANGCSKTESVTFSNSIAGRSASSNSIAGQTTSNEAVLNTSDSTFSDEFKITIYPNPFFDKTTINFTEKQINTKIKLLDIAGNEIKVISFSGYQCILEKETLSPGFYIVQIIETDNNVINEKIIIE